MSPCCLEVGAWLSDSPIMIMLPGQTVLAMAGSSSQAAAVVRCQDGQGRDTALKEYGSNAKLVKVFAPALPGCLSHCSPAITGVALVGGQWL